MLLERQGTLPFGGGGGESGGSLKVEGEVLLLRSLVQGQRRGCSAYGSPSSPTAVECGFRSALLYNQRRLKTLHTQIHLDGT